MKIKNLPKIERPREKLITKGAENLKDSELLDHVIIATNSHFSFKEEKLL